MKITRRAALMVASAAVPGLLVRSAGAQDAAVFRSRQITIIVPFGAGGGTDLVARLVADDLTRRWGQPVIVDNRPGAGGNIGAAAVARAAADGHTLLATPTGAIVLAPYAFDDIGYRTSDLMAVSILVSLPQILMVPASSPFRTLGDLLAFAKANPGKLNVGSAGKGTGQHMAGQLFMRMAGINLTDVPYRGSAQATAAVVAGEIDLLFTDPASLPQVTSGRLRALGVTTRARVPSLSDVPAIGEVVTGYEAASYYGLFAPAATPRAVQDKINAGVSAALAQPAIAKQIEDNGMQPQTGSAERSQDFVQSEAEKWGNLIKSAGIQLK